jgi:hypothetical protein
LILSLTINAYAITEENFKNEIDDKLKHILETTPNYIKILISDLNVKIVKKDIYRPTIGSNSLHDIIKNNGTRLINMCLAKSFTLSSRYFPRKE